MTQPRSTSRAFQRVILALFLVVTLSSASEAGPLGVEIRPFPVIVAGFITSSYDGTTFVAEGVARTLQEDGQPRETFPLNPVFRLTANIDSAGVATSGEFSIAGGLLGSTTLLGFAFVPSAGGVMEFLFAPATGSLVDDGTYDETEPIDVMLSGVGPAFNGSWAASWQSTAFATAMIREDPVVTDMPEPSTLVLLLTAAAGFGLTRRRTRSTIGRVAIV
jgi:hypothetical protein